MKLKHFRHILLFEFNRGAKAAETARKICAVHGDNATRGSTEIIWFSRFKEGRFDISDTPRSGGPSGFNEDCLNSLFHNGPRQCARCDELRPFHHRATFAFNGQVLKLGCIGTACSKPKPQKSAGGHIRASLLARHRLARKQHTSFLSCIVTGDEKLCLYANISKRKE